MACCNEFEDVKVMATLWRLNAAEMVGGSAYLETPNFLRKLSIAASDKSLANSKVSRAVCSWDFVKTCPILW
jgi:hypothetical protein